MPFELFAQYLKLPVFALVAARLGGLLLFQPVLGALAIPIQLRAALVLGLAALVTPVVNLPADAPDSPLGLALALGIELLIGTLLGLLGIVCFLGLQLGALLVAQESGLAFGQIIDPTSEEQETVLGVLYLQLGVVVYLIVGGHRALIAACLDTFDAIPLLAARAPQTLDLEVGLRAMTLGGPLALRVAAPALLALFLVNLALGFVSRTMPQLNVIAVGFSIKSLVAFVIMAIALPPALDAFIESLQQVSLWMEELVT